MLAPECLAALDGAAVAAERLGLDGSAVRTTAERVRRRSGFPGDLYVLALAGGTGVGKSTLLNALAGAPLSEAGARRPTTSEPVAWVPRDRLADAAPLIGWLGGAGVRGHDAATPGDVVVLDLPDLDSVATEHRARVDAVLPRVDAVLWVSDPEKYQDAILHDRYLATWGPRMARQAFVVNRIDRIALAERERLRADLAARLVAEGRRDVPVLLASAIDGALDEVRAWLADGVEAKRIVRERLAADARASVSVVARSAGIPDDASGEPAPIIPVADRERAADLAVVEVLRVVDTDGLSRQAVEATRLAARPRGGGPLGIARALVERGSGLSERRADPEGYLRRWRDRGSLVRAAEPVRGLAAAAVTRVPPAARPAWAAVADPTDLHVRLERAIDRGVAVERGRWRPPHSRLWPALGVLQLVATIAVILGAIWIAGLLAGVGRDVTASVELPLLGAVPMPVLLLAGGVIGWWVLGRVLSAHAGWLGRRWARSVRARVEDEVRRTVSEAVGGRIGDVEAARRELALATATLRSCDGAPRRDRP